MMFISYRSQTSDGVWTYQHWLLGWVFLPGQSFHQATGCNHKFWLQVSQFKQRGNIMVSCGHRDRSKFIFHFRHTWKRNFNAKDCVSLTLGLPFSSNPSFVWSYRYISTGLFVFSYVPYLTTGFHHAMITNMKMYFTSGETPVSAIGFLIKHKTLFFCWFFLFKLLSDFRLFFDQSLVPIFPAKTNGFFVFSYFCESPIAVNTCSAGDAVSTYDERIRCNRSM